MSLRHESVDVRISQQILWFGDDAYPLHNITRTNSRTLRLNRGAAIRHYIRTAVLTLIAAAVVGSVVPAAAASLVGIGVLAWLAYKAYRLAEILKIELFELVIETAAGSHRGLISNNRALVADLSLKITDAINNPHAKFEMRVENIQVGDNFTNNGGNNINKVTQ